MNKLALVDLDGCVAGFNEGAYNHCLEKGYELNVEHHTLCTSPWITDHLVVPRERKLLRKHIDESRFFLDLPLIPGAQEGIAALSQYFDVWFCSKPLLVNDFCPTDKQLWVRKHFPALQRKLILAPDKGMIRGDILIDDNFKLKWFEYATWKPVVYTQSYNSHEGSDLYSLPHFDWSEPVEKLLEYVK